MKEILITCLYWFGNIVVILWSIGLAIALWHKSKRLLKAIGLVVVGILWHGIRATYSYHNNSCENILGNENLLLLANKCIPPLEPDVVYAQVAILVGVFIVVAEVIKNQTCKNS